MKRMFNYYWRLVCTFLSFSLFGVGGIILSITLFPLIYIAPVKRKHKIRISRRIIRISFRFFIGFMRFMRVLTYEFHGAEKLAEREGLFIIANHPTLIDVVFLLSRANFPNCVVKSGVWKNVCMYFVVSSAGFIENNGNPEDMLQRCENTLKSGDGLILFPEGTRTDPDGEAVLQRAVAHIALRSQKPLTPVSITCEPITLTKKHRWFNIPYERAPHFCLSLGDDIEVKSIVDLQKDSSYSARILTKNIKKILVQ